MPESWLKVATISASRIGLRYFRWKNGSSARDRLLVERLRDLGHERLGLVVAQAAQDRDRLVAAVALDEPARALGDAQQQQVEDRRGKRRDGRASPARPRTPGPPTLAATK